MVCLSTNSDLSENINYNIKEFPASIRIGTMSLFPNYQTACHWHTDLEFTYLYDGSMDYNVNGETIHLQAGQGIFVNSSCLHYNLSPSQTECHYLCIVIHPDILSGNHYFFQQILQPILENPAFPYIKLLPSVSWQNQILLSMLDMYTSLDKKEAPLFVVKGFLNILESLYQHCTSTDKTNVMDENLTAVTLMVGFIQKNYRDKITVSDLANTGNCCITKCNDLFKTYLQTTPNLYINHYRLQKSTTLLIQTSLSITDIAYECGFSNASYYCETFRKHFQITPKSYRMENRK